MTKEMPNKLLGKQAKHVHMQGSQDTKPLINVGKSHFFVKHTQRGYHFSPNKWSKI